MALARTLSRYWKRQDRLLQEPRFVFLTNPSDGKGDVFGHMLRAATEQLIRIWRDESGDRLRAWPEAPGGMGQPDRRFRQCRSENIRFGRRPCRAHLLKESKIREVALYVPTSIGEATGSRKAMPASARTSPGCTSARSR
jgi:malonyl-CoA reductase/3-hydroxypropionate dehydrogenase (NADP+)